MTQLTEFRKQTKFELVNEVLLLRAENERLLAVLKIVDEDVRHHLRSDIIAPALLRPHAIKAVRDVLANT